MQDELPCTYVIDQHRLSPDIGLMTETEIDLLTDCLKAEADRHWSIDPNVSLKYACRIIDIGQELNKEAYIALGLMAKGDALKLQGNIHQAWHALTEAGHLFISISDMVGWARTRIGLAFICIETQTNIETTLAEATLALSILEEAGYLDRCAYLEMNIATLHTRRGHAQLALEHYYRALQYAEHMGQSGDRLLWPIYYNMALVNTYVGELRDAERNLQTAIEIALEQQETRNLALALTSAAHAKMFQGKYRQALLLLNDAVEIAGEALPMEALYAQRVMAECLMHLNRFAEARELSARAYEEFDKRGAAQEATFMLFHLATTELSLQNYEGAINALKEIGDRLDTVAPNLDVSIWHSRQKLNLGRVTLKQNRLAEADRYIAQAIQLSEPHGVTRVEALLLKSEWLLRMGRPDEAREVGHQAAWLAEKDHLPILVYAAKTLLGRIAEATENSEEAIDLYWDALATLETSQRDLTITLRPDFMQNKGEALRNLSRILLSQKDHQEAFDLVERAKSLALMSYLANRESLQWKSNNDTTAALLEKLDDIRSQYHGLLALHHQVFSKEQKHFSSSNLLEEIAHHEAELLKITEQLYLINEDTSHFGATEPPCLEEVQRNLAAGELLIEFLNDGANYWVYMIDADGFEVFRIGQSGEQIDRLVDKIRPNLEWAFDIGLNATQQAQLIEKYKKLTQRLYKTLFGQVASRFVQDMRLYIVPYGSLHYIPFSALFDGTQYLVEQYDIVILPSSGVLLQAPVNQAGGALVLTNSWNGKLSCVRDEGKIVAEHLGSKPYDEAEATRTLLSEEPLSVLHIAAHGEHRIDLPQLSYLTLEDGHIFMDDLLQEDMSYELVVLSGCETGRGNLTTGDEMIGLGRSVLLAGAGSLITSLWRIDDGSTLELMDHFYASLVEGQDKARSLRKAQVNLLNQSHSRHPAYWGAMQFIGDPKPINI